MNNKERDAFDDLFRSKLQDFEADTTPGDWEAIADRLTVKKSVPFRRTLRYWAAAAVISLLMVTGGVYVLNEDQDRLPVADMIQKETEAVETQLAEQSQSVAPVASAESSSIKNNASVASVSAKRAVIAQAPAAAVALRSRRVVEEYHETVAALPEDEAVTGPVSDTVVKEEVQEDAVAEQTELRAAETRSLVADAAPVEKKKKASVKRWGFGMGGGSVTAGTSNSLNTYAFKNTLLADQELKHLNSPYFNEQSPRTNIHHKTPVTVGVGVSYYLNNRFSLQSGLNYTFMSSSWETNGEYHRETKQKLHFIGIPLSLSYKIAEWNRIQFYAAAGAMTEINVSGKLNSKIFVGDNEIRHEKNHIRMKEWMWSVNARVGASYPLLRFLSVYAEAGADYYFDNGSLIETIRSEKPFNVNLQAGFRFGF